MRTDKLTQKSMEAIQVSQEIARDRNHNRLEPAHLALALLEQDESPGGHPAGKSGIGSGPGPGRAGIGPGQAAQGNRRRRIAPMPPNPFSGSWTGR